MNMGFLSQLQSPWISSSLYVRDLETAGTELVTKCYALEHSQESF